MRKTRRTRPAAHRIGSRQGTACCAPTTHKKEAGMDFWNTVRLAFRALARNKLRSSLTIDDMNAILREVTLIREAAPAVISRVQVVYQNQNWNTTIQGTTPNYFGIRSWPVQAGSVFGDEELDSAADVCVLGTTVAGYLFGTESPVGKQIRIGNLPFRVVGVLESKGQSVMGDDQDDRIFAPYTT